MNMRTKWSQGKCTLLSFRLFVILFSLFLFLSEVLPAATEFDGAETLADLNSHLRSSLSHEINETAVSSCSVESGCPHSSMVWATGTFTFSELLTPPSFIVESNLTLKLSLCCGYKYDGQMLRNAALYDAFLQTLLQATPFQDLTAEERRRMFPRERVVIFDTINQRRYDAHYVRTEEDIAQQNDGDGDVLLLISGAVGDRVQRVPLLPSIEPDIQLKISNRVLKCKCPHTLLVMPMLRAGPDALPPVSILAIGPHCALGQAARHMNQTIRPRIYPIRRSDRNAEGVRAEHQWAVSFAVDPPLLPATQVRWVITDGATDRTVLDETVHIAAVVRARSIGRSRANSSFIPITPHRRYRVQLSASRGALVHHASGEFVLRLPLNRKWPIEQPAPRAHYGVVRQLRPALRTESELSTLLDGNYITYWANAPRDDQPLTQTPRRVLQNESSTPFPLFVGRNDVSFFVTDMDEVCDPTLLETHELWALQAILLVPPTSPTTACDDAVPVQALGLRRTVNEMLKRLHVSHLNTTGKFNCTDRATAGPCELTLDKAPHKDSTTEEGTMGVLWMRRRGVAELAWTLHVDTTGTNVTFIPQPEDLDPSLARFLPVGSANTTDSTEDTITHEMQRVVELHSPEALVVRRMSSVPTSVAVQLSMDATRLTLKPPSFEGASLGRWAAISPLRIVSVDEHAVVVLDTSHVPNVAGTLPPGTLRFIAEDAGEEVILGTPYKARCPPRIVEHVVTVVAIPATPIVPAIVIIYTEERCVRMQAPRGPQKDEHETWRVAHCLADARVEELHSADKEGRSGATVCGLESFKRCEAIWEARNLAGAVTQTFSLRRCRRPPPLRFYKVGKVDEVLALPAVEWVEDDAGRNGTVLRVIPLAGHDASVGYAFDYNGPQRHFLAEFTDEHRAAHQLYSARRHFARDVDVEAEKDADVAVNATPLLLRRLRPEEKELDSATNDTVIPYDWYTEDDAKEDYVAGVNFTLLHKQANQYLEFTHMGKSVHYPLRYEVRPTPPDPHTAAAADAAEFARRGMCVAISRPISVFAISPLGAVLADARLPAPPPAIAVVPFCSAAYDFSRHPWLYTKYHFDFTWSCPADGTIFVSKYTATHSILRHVSDTVWESDATAVCTLTVRNNLTDTIQVDKFLLRRVYPSRMEPTLVFLSDGAAHGVCAAAQRRVTKTRWTVGRTLLLHVDGPAESRTSIWRAVSVVPSTTSSIGTQRLLDDITFTPLGHPHPLAISRGRAGSTAVASGFIISGLYTIQHSQPDPENPGVCPNITLTETVHVTLAQVVHKEIVVCGDAALLAAVPIPSEIECEFTGQWEMVSVQISPDVTFTAGANFTGVRFDHGARPRTLVRGLPFGIVTLRWAIYTAATDTQPRILVDYDTMRVLVMTENLPSNRAVTLSDGIEIHTTRSTLHWTLAPLDEADEVRLRGGGGILGRGGTRIRAEVAPNNTDTAEIITAEHLPVGTTRLRYELHASPRLFGPMLGRECVLRVLYFEIERVTAFLSANTTLDHECDAYTERGHISLCLHAEGSPTEARVNGRKSETSKISNNNNNNKNNNNNNSNNNNSNDTANDDVEDNSIARGEGKGYTPNHSEAGNRDNFGTRSSLLDGRVQLVSPDEFEFRVKAAATSLTAAGCSVPWWATNATRWIDVRPNGRCISFTVAAIQHMSPQNVSHFLFATHDKIGCPSGEDFIPSTVIDGASAWRDGPVTTSTRSAGSNFGSGMSGNIVGGVRGTGLHGPGRFLPVLDPTTLARDRRSMRPLLSLRGVPDAVVSELDVSGEDIKGNATAAVVTLRLDAALPQRTGGFFGGNSGNGKGGKVIHWDDWRRSLLVKCVRGELRGNDVLKYWTEVNRPDGAEGQTAPAWLDYTRGIGNAVVQCEPLFPSLAHLMPRPEDTDATLKSRRSLRIPPREQRLVSVQVVEQQLESLQRAYRWTRDGIDVTGLRAELQEALTRRRLTRQQFEEISRTRREQQEGTTAIVKTEPDDAASRLDAVLRLYRGVTGAEAAAVRLILPHYAPFAVPHTLFLRTAVHKDVICGTRVQRDGDPPNPYALVLFGRVEITDAPPRVQVWPPIVKECELEGDVPVMEVTVSGTTVAADPFPPSRVELEEIPNPNLTGFAIKDEPGVGLSSCLPLMRTGMRVATSPATRKHLLIQLAPCPSLQMLSLAEYNEHQDSGYLLWRLQFPRLLRITLHGALAEDSHTAGRTSVSFVVEVRPTLAQLHLRTLPTGDGTLKTEPWVANNRRPLVVCEADMRRHGVELGMKLIGDTWNTHVGADYDIPESSIGLITMNGIVGEQPPARRRSPHDVALLNSFSIVEHYSLDSAHHLLLRHGGLYRSHFVSYIFSSVLTDPENQRQHRFVHRYNSTFVSVRIPPDPSGRVNMDEEWSTIPPVRPFSAIEEILFAVPGIATECRGCLLADTTYFVAGDLTGLWSFPPVDLPPLENSALSAPLRIPFHTATHVPRKWHFTFMCPIAAWDNLIRFRQKWAAGQPQLQLELIVYGLRDMLGGEVPLTQRPTILLGSAPLHLTSEREETTPTLLFHVNETVAERAHAMMAADFVRYGRRHLHTVYDYIRDTPRSGGALAVNASVFLKLCAPVLLGTQCSIVSVTHSLLLLEEPRARPYYAHLRSESLGGFLNPIALLHHGGTALVGYFIFPRLRFLHALFAIGSAQDSNPTRVGLTVALFVAALFLYQMAVRLWAVLWILLWGSLFILVPETIVGLYFVLHFLYWAFVM